MDEIQRKLALLDKQSAGSSDFFRQIIQTAPLLFAATGLIAGILIQDTFNKLQVWGWLVLLCCCGLSAIIFFIRQRGQNATILACAALFCFVCLGAIRLISFYTPSANDIRNFAGTSSKLATIRGVITSEPYINKHEDWEFTNFQHFDPGSSFYFKLQEVETTNGWAETVGNLYVRVAEPVLDLKAGNYIQAYCWLERFEQPTNPGQFNFAEYMAKNNIFIAASIKSRDGIELIRGHADDKFTEIKNKLTQAATNALLDDIPQESLSRPMLHALLLGYRRDIDADTYTAFSKTGLLHFISLSGLHFGIFIGIVWWLCKTAGLLRSGRAIVCALITVIFLMVLPARPPTVRAAVICLTFCAAILFRRQVNPLNTLSLAAIILLLIRPTGIFEVGWQLSFSSVLGIILFADRIHFFLYEKIYNMPWLKNTRKSRPFFRIISRPGPYILRLFTVGVAAWAGGAGILLYHFYTIYPLTSLWTVFVFPFVAGILLTGFLKIIFSFLLPSLAAILGTIAARLSDWLIWIVKIIAGWNISEILTGKVPLVIIILWYIFIIFAAFIYFKRPFIKKTILIIMLLTLAGSLSYIKWQRIYRDDLTMTSLDVGHGQAIFVQFPGKSNILFDAGSLNRNNVGGQIIVPFLKYIGISRIDRLIISHNDVDHINGIPEIIKNCNVKNIYVNNAFLSESADEWGTARFLEGFLNAKGLTTQLLSSKESYPVGKARLTILWPTEETSLDNQISDNDKSVVSLIEFAGKKILLCSDIEQFAQKKLLELYPNLKADIVVVPHHGSTRTLADGFLEGLNAEILICSSGKKGTIQQKSALYATSDGVITFSISKKGRIKIK